MQHILPTERSGLHGGFAAMTVYDFDNTIYRGESSIDFFRFCLRRKPSLVRFLPIVFWKLLRYKRCRTTADEIIHWGEHVLRAFLSEVGDVDELVNAFWTATRTASSPFTGSSRSPTT